MNVPSQTRFFSRLSLSTPSAASRGFLLLLLMALPALLGVSCAGPDGEAGAETIAAPASAGAAETETAVPTTTAFVRAEDVAVTTWQDAVDLSAELLPWAAVTVAAETSGRVLDLQVEHGDRVRAGQVLARLEAKATAAEVAQAQARVKSTETALRQAELDLERGVALAGADGIVSQDDVDRWTLARDSRQAEVAEAKAALLVMRERLDDMEIRAPFAAVVSERHVEKGSWVSAGSPVFRLVAADRLKAQAAVTSTDRLRIRLGNPATFHTDALRDVAFPAQLRFLGQEADAATATFLVEAEIDPRAAEADPDSLLAGLQGTLKVVLATHEGLLVPRTAVLSTSAGSHVFVIEDGRAAKRAVDLDVVDGRRAAVLSGLQAGDRLVVQGQHRLADGQAVEEQDS